VGKTSLSADLSSDGGVIVPREQVLRLGLAEVIAGPLAGERDAARIVHTYCDMALASTCATG
jgi:hypothetical protein